MGGDGPHGGLRKSWLAFGTLRPQGFTGLQNHSKNKEQKLPIFQKTPNDSSEVLWV